MEDENSLQNYVTRCLHDQEDLIFNFYIISCQLNLLLRQKIISRPYLNNTLNKLLTDAGILDSCNRVQIFCALHPLDIDHLDLQMQKGFQKYGLKMPNYEYRHFIADPTIPLPFTYGNKEKTFVHKAESGLFNNKRKKSLMDNPLMFKLFLRAVWLYKEEVFNCINNDKMIPHVVLKDIAFKTGGNTIASNRQSTVLFIATCSFTIYSNQELLRSLMDVFDRCFSLEYKEKIMFKPSKLIRVDKTIFLNLLAGKTKNDKLEYQLIYDEEQITPFRTGSVNTFFGAQYPKNIVSPPIEKEREVKESNRPKRVVTFKLGN